MLTKIEVRCLYCDVVTGHSYHESSRKTVCNDCMYASHREEAREIAAGMRPWARPLSYWVRFFGQKPVQDQQGQGDQ